MRTKPTVEDERLAQRMNRIEESAGHERRSRGTCATTVVVSSAPLAIASCAIAKGAGGAGRTLAFPGRATVSRGCVRAMPQGFARRTRASEIRGNDAARRGVEGRNDGEFWKAERADGALSGRREKPACQSSGTVGRDAGYPQAVAMLWRDVDFFHSMANSR